MDLVALYKSNGLPILYLRKNFQFPYDLGTTKNVENKEKVLKAAIV
jgi:hypothetical protein